MIIYKRVKHDYLFKYSRRNTLMEYIFISFLTLVVGGVAPRPAQLHHYDKIHQQARESQTHDEPATGQEPQHPVRGFPRF